MRKYLSLSLAFLIGFGATLPELFAQAQFQGSGGGGGSSSITSGTTPISGGATTQVCFNDAGTLSCGDAGITLQKTDNTLTTTGGFIGPDGTAVAVGLGLGSGIKGFYGSGNSIYAAIGGNRALHVDSISTVRIHSGAHFGWPASGGADGALDTAFARVSAGRIRVSDGSTGYGTLVTGLGTAALPSLSVGGPDLPSNGLYQRTSANIISYSLGGILYFEMSQGSLGLKSDSLISWYSGAIGISAIDVALARGPANFIEVNNGTTGGGGFQFIERTTPSAPAANKGLLYAKDNGGGKTQLCAIFNSGAEQCFATEP